MMAHNPTFTSVEFRANELLAVHSGCCAPGVNSCPAFRSAAELRANRAVFASLNVQLAADCETSANYFFVPFVTATAVGTGACYAAHGYGSYTYACALTPARRTRPNAAWGRASAPVAST